MPTTSMYKPKTGLDRTVVMAMQYDGEDVELVVEMLKLCHWFDRVRINLSDHRVIETMSGPLVGELRPLDWVVCGKRGAIGFMNDEKFCSTYEPVE